MQKEILRQVTTNCGILLTPVLVMLLWLTGCNADKDWRTASRDPSGILPDPQKTEEAVLAAFSADACT